MRTGGVAGEPSVSRENLLGHRALRHGLTDPSGARRPGEPSDRLQALLGIGVQDTPAGTALTALAVRGLPMPAGPVAPAGTRVVWTWRGAPHLHREQDLIDLAAATWPVDDEDATRRIANPRIAAGARRGLAAFVAAAQAMREVVTEKLPKGEVSRLVSAAVPADLTYACGPCSARHISGGLFQLVGVGAGVQVLTEGRSSFLTPLPDDVRASTVPRIGAGVGDQVMRYLNLNGPVSTSALAGFTGMHATALKRHLPQGLTQVRTPAGPAWLPVEEVAAVQNAVAPRMVRLLPGGDPWLSVRDRELIVPDERMRRAVYPALGAPGVLLVDGEVTGTWRSRLRRSKVNGAALELTVTGLDDVPARRRDEVEEQAGLVAAARGAARAVVLPG